MWCDTLRFLSKNASVLYLKMLNEGMDVSLSTKVLLAAGERGKKLLPSLNFLLAAYRIISIFIMNWLRSLRLGAWYALFMVIIQDTKSCSSATVIAEQYSLDRSTGGVLPSRMLLIVV